MRMPVVPRSGAGWRCIAIAVALSAVPTAARAVLDAEDCAACHSTETRQGATTGGHAAVLDCASCHADRRRDRVGPHHRAVALCADCHQTPTGHPDTASLKHPRRANRNCLTCHDPHGSTNLHLVRTQIVFRQKVMQAVFTTEEGAAPGGFTHPDDPGSGLCESCHRKTKVYRRNGTG